MVQLANNCPFLVDGSLKTAPTAEASLGNALGSRPNDVASFRVTHRFQHFGQKFQRDLKIRMVLVQDSLLQFKGALQRDPGGVKIMLCEEDCTQALQRDSDAGVGWAKGRRSFLYG